MVSEIRVSFRAVRVGGGSITPDEFLSALQVGASEYKLEGSGNAWQAARVVLCDLTRNEFENEAEPSEAFATAIRKSLVAAATWLSRISTATVHSLPNTGVQVDFFVNLLLDDSQLDLSLPPELVIQLGRLSLPIEIISND